ncbi:hypothetical protein Agub_g11632, partial [Astrephomene gubernaculifera]
AGDGGDNGGGGGRKRGGMGFGSGRSRRMGGGGGGLLVRSDSKSDLTEALKIGSPAALQVALWVRLRVLMPLLPLIYKDREPDPRRNLRCQLVPALLQLLASHLLWSQPQSQPSAAAAAAGPAGTGGGGGVGVAAAADVASAEGGEAALAAAAGAAAALAGEALHERLLHVLSALVCDQWASWLKPPGLKKLKDVPPYDNVPQLLADLDLALSASAAAICASATAGSSTISSSSASAGNPPPAVSMSSGTVAALMGGMRERITAALPLQGVMSRQLLPLQPPPAQPSTTTTAAATGTAAEGTTATGGSEAAFLATANTSVSSAGFPGQYVEVDPAALLPLESLTQVGDVSAQPYSGRAVQHVSYTGGPVYGSTGGEAGGMGSGALLAGAVRMKRSCLSQWLAAAEG